MLETVQAIAAIVLIDLALSGDNALVIGVVARGLPRSKRRQAIVFGAGAAVVLRIAAAAAATVLLRIPWLQLVGGIALVVIAYRLVRPEAASGRSPREMTTLRAAVATIVMADFAMSLENILGVAAAAHGDLALLLFGLALSIPIVLFGSGLVIRILDRFPRTIWLAAVALVLTAADLILGDPSVSPLTERLPFARELLRVTFLAVRASCAAARITPPPPPWPRGPRLTVRHGMTQTATSSTRGVARETSTRAKSTRGPSAIQPMGSPSRYATSPGVCRRRARRARAARRGASPLPVSPRSCSCFAVKRGKRSQQVAPQVPAVTVFTSSTRAAVSGRIASSPGRGSAIASG